MKKLKECMMLNQQESNSVGNILKAMNNFCYLLVFNKNSKIGSYKLSLFSC